MKSKFDYIIVGLGLAGISFVEKLINEDKTFVVFDNNSQNSSMVAGGVYNPVVLKRFTPVWNGHQQIEKMHPFYKKVANKLSIKLDHQFETKKIFNSVADENNWFLASDKPTLALYMNPKISKEKIQGIVNDFGTGSLQGTGRIDTALLVNSYKKYLDKQNNLIKDAFNYANLHCLENELTYENIHAKNIVFCEGFGITKNPFFNYLPLNEAKGETITIYAPELKIDFLVKSSIFIMPLKEADTYKVGATFNWKDKTSVPTLEGKKELQDKLDKVIEVPYKILSQSAGIRPTVKDRRPLVGKHPKYQNLFVLNGLGTRGVMIGPTISENLFDYIENNIPLDESIDIKRFEKLFT